MKKIVASALTLLIFACSTDKDEIVASVENTAPSFGSLNFQIDEHSESGTLIGTLSASDADNDDLTYSLDTSLDITINETTGALTTGENLVLDFEANNSLSVDASVFDGQQIVDGVISIALSDINEYDFITDAQREMIQYLEYLVLWQGPNSTATSLSSRWKEPMKLYLDGQISSEFQMNVEAAIEEYNTFFEESDFNISLVNSIEESNAHLFYGEVDDVENLWQDMFDLINGGNFSGYAITPNTNGVLIDSRIWISNPAEALFKHELGHALGFGHSDRCDSEKSVMCSSISLDSDFLDVEKTLIRYAYHNVVEAGLSSDEIRMEIANLILLGE